MIDYLFPASSNVESDLDKLIKKKIVLTLTPLSRTDSAEGRRKKDFHRFEFQTVTVYRHNKGNFSQLPVCDTLSTYPSASHRTKAFTVSFHLVTAASSQSYLAQALDL